MDRTYELCVYKNPKVGHKPPKIVPFLTNCWYGVDDPARDRRGNNLPAGAALGRADGRGRGVRSTKSHAWKAKAEKVKGQLSSVAATARLLLHQEDGPTFESLVPGYQAAMDSHDAVERRWDALVEAATDPAFEPHPPPLQVP